VDFSAYLCPLVANIHSSWFRMIPEAARAGKKGKTIIRFYVRRNGTVENLRIETSSGDDAMDEAARKAITDAAPYETLPPAYKGLLIELRFIFLYNLPVAAAKE
jgi:TonB family protein